MAISRERSMGSAGKVAMISSQFVISTFWGKRRDEPADLAIRLNRLVDQLALIDPVLSNWIWVAERPRPVRLKTIRTHLTKEIAAAVWRANDGNPVPSKGYPFGLINSIRTDPRSISVTIFAGNTLSSAGYPNHAAIKTGWRVQPDPVIVTYAVFQRALIALAESFDVIFGSAYRSDLSDFWSEDDNFRFGWINYVAPRFAPLITPPKSAIVEYRPNGGLLMAATDETFMTSNPRHLAVARDIEAALAPLNALPWPLDAEPEHATRSDLQ
jgi:hypothetical protein